MYKYLIRPILFLIDSERAHWVSIKALKVFGKIIPTNPIRNMYWCCSCCRYVRVQDMEAHGYVGLGGKDRCIKWRERQEEIRRNHENHR